MATIPDWKIDSKIRAAVADSFKSLEGNLRPRDYQELGAMFGVQPKTLEGWTTGRGSPAPKGTEGQFLYSGNLASEWQDRIIAGLALQGAIRQVGLSGIQSTYMDTLGDSATLADCIDRIKDYLSRNAGGNWFDASWRSLRIVPFGNGHFALLVTYAAGVSDQDEAL